MKKIMMTLAVVLCCAMTMTVFTSCSKDNDNPEPEPEPAPVPIEYGKVFPYDYEGQTLYYVIDEASQTATAVAPCHPDYPEPEDENDVIDLWEGYEKPKGKVVMPETVEYSGKTFPLTALGQGVFYPCSDITSLSLPEGLTIIDKGAFSCCFGMETIDLPNSLQRIGDYAWERCSKLEQITFTNQLTHIGEGALNGCVSLTTCLLPAQMEYIDQWLLSETAISHIEIPEHVARIDSHAFQECLSLQELSLPAGLTEMADSVFTLGTRHKTLNLASTVPPTVANDTFDDYSTAIFVPKGTGDAYRKDEIWGRFATINEQEE